MVTITPESSGASGGMRPLSGHYICPSAGSPASNVAMLVDRVYAWRIRFDRPGTINKALVNISSAGDGSSVIRVGLYEWDGDPTGADQIADFGSIDATSSGEQQITGLTVSVAAQEYLLVAGTNGESASGPTTRGFSPASPIPADGGYSAAFRSAVASGATVTGALPDPLPDMPTGISDVPLMVLEVAPA